MFYDSHCHLDLCKNPSDCVKRAMENKVSAIITNGVSPENNLQVLELARAFPIVKSALGLYPIQALSMSDEDIDATIKFIKKNETNIIAVGEVGMDFKEDVNQHDRQRKIFSKIIDLALEIDKPLIIHSRKAELEVIEMLEEAGVKKVQMHCFCGKMSLVKRIVANGWMLSIPTNIKHATQFQEVVKEVPIQNLLCETDAPYLHPDKERDNEPANVIESYKKIAQIKGLSLEDTAKAIERNYSRLFLD